MSGYTNRRFNVDDAEEDGTDQVDNFSQGVVPESSGEGSFNSFYASLSLSSFCISEVEVSWVFFF